MVLMMTAAKLTLPVLITVAVFGTHQLANKNGLFALVDSAIAVKQAPDVDYALLTRWTGFESVDKLFSLMTAFFLPSVNGKHPTVTLQGVHFFGQLLSLYILMVVESFRVGNAWKAVSFIAFWGLGMEWIAMAIVLPALCLTHLLTAPSAQSPKSLSLAIRKTGLLIHPVELQILPWSIAIGHFIPVALSFYFPAQVGRSIWKSQQFWIVGRLFHPIFTSVTQLVLSIAVRKQSYEYTSAAQRNRDVLRHLQAVYTFATCFAIVAHVGTLTLSFSSQLFPSMFAAEYQAAFNPITVWKPVSFWDESAKSMVGSIGVGALYFLQWDSLISCASGLIWAMALNRQALTDQPNGSSFLSMLWKTALMMLVGGPAAAAISLIKERDQVLLDIIDPSEEKKTN